MKERKHRSPARRAMALLLSLTLICGLLPAVAPQAEAASWAQEYLDKLVDWGVMRGDLEGNLEPSRNITRAEFITLVNRAYGYDQTCDIPFDDVPSSAWYADDIAIAYNVGYFTGTSETTASPTDNLTREQAAVLLGRNMMLQARSGEVLGYTDSRSFSEWSRGLITSITEAGVISGYEDGSFKPQNYITRAEVACMLTKAIGNLVQTSGKHSLGYTYGNVTISTAGVTLTDTVIAGDLYLTGGVDLGDVLLQNVTVLGKIVVSGAGESHEGDSSITLRNVVADEMVVDSIANQFVTIQADGDTSIGSTSVRTSAYLEDLTTSGTGLEYISLDGEAGTAYTLAGGINEVVNFTPASSLTIAQGSTAKLTIDEEAVGSSLSIDGSAYVKELNLDVATAVNGLGDIAHVNVNTAGSSITTLPDTITVRPGVTANIVGETMNTTTATESSADPRLLSGYPAVQNIAPTSAEAVFSTNKSGTVYWAITAVADGSVDEDDLINPPAYSGIILKSGSVKVTASNTENIVKLSGLTTDGSYYLSAIMVDSRGQRSPLKVTAFTTPDNTTPAFTSGYPYMSKITNNAAQVAVMANKSCQLYYALLPKGSVAPKAAEFKANAITGNLGYGSMEVTKNVPAIFYVNGQTLQELEDYDLYLWLTDFDGSKSSAVKKVSFTTVDMTPPELLSGPNMTKQKETSVTFTATLNEAGTFYWVVVESGAEYPKPLAGQTGAVSLDSSVAKMQVSSGLNALKSGKVSMTQGKEASINISGLEAETAYELYYVAMDKAGNYSREVMKLEFTTLDENAPTATIEFTEYNGNDKTRPLANTDIRIVFSEKIQTEDGVLLDELYQAVLAASNDTNKVAAQNEMATVLNKLITFYDLTDGTERLATVRDAQNATTLGANWAVDYRNVKIELENGNTVIIFPNGSAINLQSGSTYRFDLTGLMDTSRNKMGKTQLPDKTGFTTVFAQVNMKPTDASAITEYIDFNGNPVNTVTDENGNTVKDENGVPVALSLSSHLGFTLQPISTSKVSDSINWDMLIWTDTTMTFQLFYRELDSKGNIKSGTDGQWHEAGPQSVPVVIAADGETPLGVSLTKDFAKAKQTYYTFPLLNTLKDDGTIYEYAINIQSIGPLTEETDWNATVNMKVSIVAGTTVDLDNLIASPSGWKQMVESEKLITSIGNVVSTGSDELTLRRMFSDKRAPSFYDKTPKITNVDDSSATMTLKLDRTGTIYYEIAPYDVVTPKDTLKNIDWKKLPGDGAFATFATGEDNDGTLTDWPSLTIPTVEQITSKRDTSNSRVIWGSASVGTTAETITITGLEANTQYVIYYVIKGTANVYSEQVYTIGFKTTEVIRPVIELSINNPSVEITPDRNAKVNGLLITENEAYIKTTVLGTELSNSNLTSITLSDLQKAYPDVKTYLDAMLTDVVVNNKSIGSVFDCYVIQSAKDAVASFIRNQSVTGDYVVYKMGTTVINGNTTKTVDCSPYMSASGTPYIFLSVGVNAQGTSGDAFRAIRPLSQKDETPPMVISVNSGMYEIGKDTGIYEGGVMVTFSESVYERQSGSSSSLANIKPVLALGVLNSAPSGAPSDFIKLGSRLLASSSSIGVTVNPSSLPSAMISFSLNITGMRIGEAITIESYTLCDYPQGNTNRYPLILTLKKTTNKDGTVNVYFEVNKAWDATGN